MCAMNEEKETLLKCFYVQYQSKVWTHFLIQMNETRVQHLDWYCIISMCLLLSSLPKQVLTFVATVICDNH